MPRKPKDENDQLAKAIGEQLLAAMKRRGLSVSDLHKATGISRTVLLAYTRGNYAPGARELKLLSEHLEVSPTVLLFGSEDTKNSPYRIGEIALSSEGARLITFLMLTSQLTRKEQESLLTLTESIVQGRNPEAHGHLVNACYALLESDAGHILTKQMTGMVEDLMAPAVPALEQALAAREKKPR